MLLLSRHDLLQMDDAYLESLSEAELLSVSQRLLNDLKEVHERLNQNPRNSSLPPSSQAPYLGIAVEDEPETDEEERTEESSFSKRKDSDSSEENDLAESEFTKEGDQQEGQNSSDIKEQESGNVSSKRERGKQLGAPGFGRRHVIPPHHTDVYRA